MLCAVKSSEKLIEFVIGLSLSVEAEFVALLQDELLSLSLSCQLFGAQCLAEKRRKCG